MRNNITISQKLIPGVFALFFLFCYYSITATPDAFVSWFAQTVVVYAAWFFLLKAIMSMIVEREFEKKLLFPMCLGSLALIVSIVVFKTTPENIFVQFLQATVLYSVLTTIYGLMRDKINEKL